MKEGVEDYFEFVFNVLISYLEIVLDVMRSKIFVNL